MKPAAFFTTVPAQAPSRYWRETALVLVLLLALAGIMSFEPIAQDLGYHDLADRRLLLGIANFANVVSNLPFLVVGTAGLLVCLGPRKTGASSAWATFFAGAALTGFGSGYYHLAPANATLIWDRLPMTVAFMGLLVALLSEHAGERLARYLLLPAILAGVASIGWWHHAGDLRFYIWVQAAPLLMVPLALLLFQPRYTHRAYLLYGLGFYLLAKITEFYDRELYSLTAETLSGHSLKHLLASVSALYVYLMLRRRAPVRAFNPANASAIPR